MRRYSLTQISEILSAGRLFFTLRDGANEVVLLLCGSAFHTDAGPYECFPVCSAANMADANAERM